MELHAAGPTAEDDAREGAHLVGEHLTNIAEAAASSDGLGATWKIWRRRRHVLTLLAFFGYMIKVVLRVNMNVAVVAMTDERALTTQNGTTVYVREFDWDAPTKGLLLSIFFYGYTLTQIPGGILATKLGGHKMFGWGIAFTSVTTLLTPAIARAHLHLLMAVRLAEGLAEGFLSASIELLWGRWMPLHERSRHVAFACSGIPWGDIVGLSMSGLVADSLGWPAIFYVTGACGMAWFVFWWRVVKEHPHLDPHISPSELEFIQRSLGPAAVQNEGRIPFLGILTSFPVWAILIAGMSNCWNHYTFAMHLPSYLKDVMQFDLQEAGVLSAVPYLVEVSLMFVFAHLADALVHSNLVGVTASRKMCICGCLAIIAGATLLVSQVRMPAAVLACLSVVQTFDGVAWSLMLVNQLDIAPRYASILTGLHHTTCSLTGATGPILTGHVTQGKRAEDWVVLFYVAAGVNAAAAVFYALCGSGLVQPWAAHDRKSAAKEDHADGARPPLLAAAEEKPTSR